MGFNAEKALAQSASSFENGEYLANDGLDGINASSAYVGGFTGANTLIVVIDDGFDVDHPEFGSRVVAIDDTSNRGAGGGMPEARHGTHVAGIAAAARDDVEMHGVAFDADLAFFTFGNIAGETLAFQRASQLEATVINNSWGTEFPLQTLTDAEIAQGVANRSLVLDFIANVFSLPVGVTVTAAEVDQFVNAILEAQETSVVVFANSNNAAFSDVDISSGLPLLLPELVPGWITVVNVDDNGTLRSAACGRGSHFCMAGPGWNIYSTYEAGGYGSDSGTSMASPHVSGAVALASQMFPDASPEELAYLVMQTATDIGAPGVDDQFGWGFLNLQNLAAVADPSTAQMGPVTQVSQISTLNAFMDAMNSQMGLGGSDPGGIQALGFAARDASSLDNVFPLREAVVRRAWLSPMGEYLHVDNGATWNGYQTRSGGLAFGVEMSREEEWRAWRVGAALGLSYADTDGDDSASDGETTGFHAGVYTGLRSGGWEFDGSLQLAYLKQDQSRYGVGGVGAVNQTANASFDSVAVETNTRIGYAFDLVHQTTLTPFVSADARVMHHEGYTETGAGVFNLTVASDTIVQAEIGPGLRIERAFQNGGNWEFAGALDISYSYVIGDHTPTSQATMLGRSITSPGVDIGRHVATIGTELVLGSARSDLAASLRYEGRFRENAMSHSLTGSLVIPF
ncbi:MAG: S8 family peptidase [Hyphomicrobiales bacterium]